MSNLIICRDIIPKKNWMIWNFGLNIYNYTEECELPIIKEIIT